MTETSLAPPPTPANDILDQIRPVSENDPWLNVFLYGDGGVGKTVCAADSPNTLVLDCDKSSRSLLNHPQLKNTPVLRIDALKKLSDIFWKLKAGALPHIETVVVDNLSELQKITLVELLKAKSAAQGMPINVPSQPDYQQNTAILRKMVTEFRDLERNVVFTAHVERDKDGLDGHIFLRPAVTPKLAETLEGIFDLMGFMWLENNEGNITRKLQIMPSRLIKAKSRVGGLPPIIENPTMKMLLAANREGIENE